MENLDLNKLKQGHPAQWRAFVDAAAPIVLATVRRVFASYGRSASAEEQEDVSQDVLVKLSRDQFGLLKRFDPAKAKLSTFVGVVARSTAIDHLRKLRPQTQDIDDYADKIPAKTTGFDGGGDPAQSKMNRSAKNLLAQMLASLLSDKQRYIIELLFDHDMDPEDVAAKLNVEVQTIRSAKHKALSKIRSHLGELPDGGRNL